jgi:hypothetical protein
MALNRQLFSFASSLYAKGQAWCETCKEVSSQVETVKDQFITVVPPNDRKAPLCELLFCPIYHGKSSHCKCGRLKFKCENLVVLKYLIAYVQRALNGEKIKNGISFGSQLRLPGYASPMHLRCILEHLGDSPFDGHFISWVNRSSNLTKYYKMDDICAESPTLFSGSEHSRNVGEVEPAMLLYEFI